MGRCMHANIERTGAQFQTTQWTLLEDLQCSDETRQQNAAAHLADQYWPPAYAWLRKRGVTPEKASECTQAFFHDVVLSRKLFERADRTRGRLRDLLKTALKNYLIDYNIKENRRRDRLSVDPAQIEREESMQSAASDVSPDDVFDTRWALAILEQAMLECQKQFSARNQDKYWRAFELWTLQPALYGNDPPPRADIARECGFADEGHVSVAVHTVKQRLKVILEQTVARTVDDAADTTEEFERVQSILQNK